MRRLFALIGAGGIAGYLLVRLAAPAEMDSAWAAESALTVLILLAMALTCAGLAGSLRRRDRKQAQAEHLAQLGLLAGGLAHEIRNTLNAMHSQIALLRKHLGTEDGSPAAERVRQIERAVVELEELVNDLLAVARPPKDQPEDVDLAGLVREVLDFMALDLERAQVQVVTELAADLPAVYVDAGKLKRALLNLVLNARQAMPDGGTLTLRVRPADRRQVVIEVSDTGCGIPADDRPRIFQTFFSTKPGGTGLGLAVVKRTIEDFGGRISFDSAVGLGTTFRICLPVPRQRRPTAPRRAESANVRAGV
jgi:two-component system sensor histidine kinase AtoS